MLKSKKEITSSISTLYSSKKLLKSKSPKLKKMLNGKKKPNNTTPKLPSSKKSKTSSKEVSKPLSYKNLTELMSLFKLLPT